MPERLITRVQDVKGLEVIMRELDTECVCAKKRSFQLTSMLLPKRRTLLSTVRTPTSGRRWLNAPIMAGLEKLQARFDEITTKLEGTKKDVSDRRDTMTKRHVSTSAVEAETLIKESARATREFGANDRRGVRSILREPVTSQLRGSTRVISMIDEMMTLLEAEQVGDDDKKVHYIKSFDETMRPRRLLVRSLDTRMRLRISRISCPAKTFTLRPCGNRSLSSRA